MEAVSAVDKAILDPIEHRLDSIGLMSGQAAPLKRSLFGATLGVAVVWGLKPDLFWNGSDLRGWKVTSGKDTDTYFPWWLAVGFPAFVMGVMI